MPIFSFSRPQLARFQVLAKRPKQCCYFVVWCMVGKCKYLFACWDFKPAELRFGIENSVETTLIPFRAVSVSPASYFGSSSQRYRWKVIGDALDNEGKNASFILSCPFIAPSLQRIAALLSPVAWFGTVGFLWYFVVYNRQLHRMSMKLLNSMLGSSKSINR